MARRPPVGATDQRRWRATLSGVLLLTLVATVLLGTRGYDVVRVPTSSMAPWAVPGDRLLVRSGSSPQVGDVVIVRSQAWGDPAGTLVVKRVAALPGQRVICCTDGGRVSVDGMAARAAPDPRQADFDVVVPAGRIFLLGDNGPQSKDSRARLSRDAGTLPLDAVVGVVVLRLGLPRR